MRLEFGLYSALLAASLGAAYWASLPAKDNEEGKVALLSLEPKQITEVELFAKGIEVKAKRREADGRFWIEHKKLEPNTTTATSVTTETATATATTTQLATTTITATQTGTGTGTETATASTTQAETKAPEPVKPQETVERFLGNEKMGEFLAMFAPLQALRVIGKVDAAQLKEYGLDDQSSKIVIKSGGQTLQLVLGKKSYGNRNQFALEGDRVILIDGQEIENFERAQYRLFDRRLVAFEFDEVDKTLVTVGDRSKRMVHTQRDKNGELIWAAEQDPATAVSSYGLLMDRIGKLRVSTYISPDKQEQLKQLTPYFEIAFEKDGKVKDRLLVFKQTSADGKSEYFARSDFLNMYVQLANARMEVIEKDVEQVVATQ